MMILCFDLDDTLYDRTMPFYEAVQEYDPLLLEHATIEELYAAFVRRGNEVFDDSQKGIISKEEMYIYRFCKSMEDLGMSYSPEEALAFHAIYETKASGIHMSETVRTMLEGIADKGVKMAVITNGLSGHQRDKLRALQMDRWIPEEDWFVSGDCNRPKPDPCMYEALRMKYGAKPEEMCYIGDSYSRDMAGAFALGWKTVWYNKKGRELKPEDRKPDYIVHSEEEMKWTLMLLV